MTENTLPQQSIWQQIFTKNMLLCIYTGFCSGLPLFVLIQLIPAWFTSENLDIKAIAAFTLISLPYTFKFLWAALLDRYPFPFLGRRRGWIFVAQIVLIVILGSYGFFDPKQDITLISILSLLFAFASATQDIVIDAYRREILTDNQLGLGNSIHVNAYRVAGLIPGGLSLALADHMAWESVFMITAAFLVPGLLITIFFSDEKIFSTNDHTKPFYTAFVDPFKEFFTRKGVYGAIGLILFIFLYKLGDSLATTLQTKFILDMGFTKTHIASVVKLTSFWCSIGGGIIGGIAMIRLGINRALWIFGVVQIITILGFAYLASFGHFDTDTIGISELIKLGFVISGEYLGVGLGTVAFVAFMARETNPMYTAMQLAIFTSLYALPSKLLGAGTGWFVEQFGYYHFFIGCFFVAIPGMICLFWVAPWSEKVTNT
ncbi:AmpG family muropeptide MFS transporter [Pasteurella skyensis]|uniref:AmpG family muropeptide MFS transporter n=1 Tax=Phocoenobacter skyensis TaxID=97481 RepID=A0AAJ6P0B1_9PAST|nr:AmpG family muropeptide MFS transporter [Pasteurella skyensis]MDP8162522.1 AmpG family muropeptide MFS transporter [Pasteurella skyensis]MDP8170763.1 AmpG family muropeptide MFS transporter [Pasteurella skyensis]MDP8172487.1 AmpG family muropeptide MFS transporter [Pasteurella skyensis]MDP8174918.1 AmpG family muropeptide MFS transporter [Pasteurella skyensis]MDP8177512.1 AmpG family muropeptide MFS transporter [Pasteurella skyensis]